MVCAISLPGTTCCLFYLGQLPCGGRRISRWLLVVVSVPLGWLEMVLLWQISQWGSLRLESTDKKSSAKGAAM